MHPCPVVYSSSPLSYSFSEADQEKYVILINADVHQKLSFNKRALSKGKRLLRQRFESIGEALLWLQNNQNTLVEITMVTDDFLSVADRKALHEAHDGIVNIIPEVKNRAFILDQQGAIDINRSIENLFVDYFHHSKGQQPDAATMELFKEVLGTEE
jgi:exonuclease SbcD